MSREKQIEEMANDYYDAMLEARGTLGSMNEGAPKWYAKKLYAKGYRKQDWISVEDRLPEETGKYLVATKNGIVYQTKFYSGGKWGQKDKGRNITHWMPLPEAPKMKGGAE